MNRWVHALFGTVAVMVVLGLVLLWPRATTPPPPAPSVPPSGLPAPTGAPSVPAESSPPCPGVAPVRLRVATFNIHGAVGRAGYDPEGIAEEIRGWDADVVLLQEVHRFRRVSGLDDMPAVLGRLLGMEAVFGRNFTRPAEADGAPRRQSGTAILSARPIESWANRLLPNFPGLQQRGLLRATVRVGGERVDVFNTHFQHTAGIIRVVQARGVARLVRGSPRPFLLGGDFNAEPGSPAMDVIARVATDPWPEVGVGAGLTVPPREPRRRIDFVLHGPGGWVPEQAQVVQSGIADHRAVLVDYVLPRRVGC